MSKSHSEGKLNRYITEQYAPKKKRIAGQIAAAQDDEERYTGSPLGDLLKQEMELERGMASKAHEARELKARIRNQDYADYEKLR